MGRRPKVLLIASPVREVIESKWTNVTQLFDIVTYDCKSTEEFKLRLQPDGEYSSIDAIVRTGWRNAGPFVDHIIFCADFVQYYPKSLRIICCTGHGHDLVNLNALTTAGIWYCNTPDCATEAVANTGLYLILAAYRYFSFAEDCARRGPWMRSRELGTIAIDPYGQILGIVGLGDIGLAVARKASLGLGMKIHYFNPRRKLEAEAALHEGATYHSSLESLLAVADCICLSCPYTPETHHMFSTTQFALAKKSGLRLVNVARGKIVHEKALIEALGSSQVIAWASDVHENEPEITPRLKSNYMTTLLPHIGVCSKSTWRNFEEKCLNSLEGFFYGTTAGQKPMGALNSVDYRARE
ncbi:uncharacterized protein BHQ10_003320 [Talaromyces amestolkiae]|uniref:D-isomer specific 2-hydroxyacid dehydrogenase NAD-binding domain-containing protein n=1 Tax=Talaromyces amestolkiae TaxID=1196081 RepID=A0A364KUT1_TALAM|nr:uncharacterized protein BHQ10_003320 [Talaromyces amestolkiae]RAO67308.1 hypothetical protein BHQ10_003320 [Talaromyces amestolkiae]